MKVLHDFLEALSFGHVGKVELRVVLACDLLPPVRRLLSSASALLLVHPASFGDLVHLVLLVVASASNLVDRCRQYLEYSTSIIIIISLCYWVLGGSHNATPGTHTKHRLQRTRIHDSTAASKELRRCIARMLFCWILCMKYPFGLMRSPSRALPGCTNCNQEQDAYASAM